MAKMKMAVCAYCGEYTLTEREHVVPETYAPEELRKACKWVCVSGCPRCNRGFSADESDFRGFAVPIDAPGDTLVKDALFHDPVTGNWRRPEGKGAFLRMLRMIRKPDGSNLSSREELLTVKGLVIVPDEGVLRVVRKFIRGLYFHHFTQERGFPQVLDESRIAVVPVYERLRNVVEFLSASPGTHAIHPAVFVYAFAEYDDLPGIDSLWLLYACKGPAFLGIVQSNASPWM
jgi:hypothetical protein